MRRLAMGLLWACLSWSSAWAKPLVYCSEASPEGFDPGLWDSSSTAMYNSQMFEGLVGFARGGTALVPRLAQSWTISPDAKTFTFRLRPGVRFHQTADFTPTRTLNADDVVSSFQRFIDRQHPFNRVQASTYVYPESLGLAKMLVAVEKLDDLTVRFRLAEPNVVFLSYFAMSFAAIHSAEYIDSLVRSGRTSQLNTRPVGTGPYRFKSYLKDNVMRMEAHPGYWGGPQRTTQLIFSITREPSVRVQKLLAGECHVTAGVRDLDLRAIDKRPDVRLLKTRALNISYLSYNMARPITGNRAVREALDIAIDRAAIFKTLFPRGDAMSAVSAFPPAIPGYHAGLKNEYNPERARRLLAQAGYPDGFALDLWALPVARPTNPNGQLLAQLIQQDWAKIGVRAAIKTYEWGEYLKRANKGEHDVYMSGWTGDNGDADDFLAPNLTCAANTSGVKFCNPAFDALVARARQTAEPAKRHAMYEQAQEIFHRERPWSPIAHSAIYVPIRADVEGLVLSPNGGLSFEGVYRR